MLPLIRRLHASIRYSSTNYLLPHYQLLTLHLILSMALSVCDYSTHALPILCSFCCLCSCCCRQSWVLRWRHEATSCCYSILYFGPCTLCPLLLALALSFPKVNFWTAFSPHIFPLDSFQHIIIICLFFCIYINFTPSMLFLPHFFTSR